MNNETELRRECKRLRNALQTIADAWPFERIPEPEDYHDTESAYNNGEDVGTWKAAAIARAALEK